MRRRFSIINRAKKACALHSTILQLTSKSETTTKRGKSQSVQAKGRPRVITRSKGKPKKANSAESPLVSLAPKRKGVSADHVQKSNKGTLSTSHKFAFSSSGDECDALPLSPSQSLLSIS